MHEEHEDNKTYEDETPQTHTTMGDLLRETMQQPNGWKVILGVLVVIISGLLFAIYLGICALERSGDTAPDTTFAVADDADAFAGGSRRDTTISKTAVVPREFEDDPPAPQRKPERREGLDEDRGEQREPVVPPPPPLPPPAPPRWITIDNPLVTADISFSHADKPEGTIEELAVTFGKIDSKGQAWLVRRLAAEIDALHESVRASKQQFATIFAVGTPIGNSGRLQYQIVLKRLDEAKALLAKTDPKTIRPQLVLSTRNVTRTFLESANQGWFARTGFDPIPLPDFTEVRENPAYRDWTSRYGRGN